jgi:hypothetical protein
MVAQDSLYFIGSLQGINTSEPISNVSKIGDINGDGNDDFITCIPSANYCNIYFGGENFNLEPDIVLKSPSEIYDFGFFLGDVGDVNKDGYSDFIIQGKSDSLFFIGNVFLYFGGEVFDTIPDFSFHDYFIQDALGASISGGDVNDDGYSDFIIGNPYNWTNGIGRAYLFLGGETIADTPHVTFRSDSLEDFYGDDVSLDGDINGDGLNDLLISAPNFDSPDPQFGFLYIYYGDTINIGNMNYTLSIFNESVAPYSSSYLDFNNDGFSDFFLTQQKKLFYGSNEFNGTSYLEFSSSEEMDSFGETARNAGDINNDGYDDLIIGATNHRNDQEVMVGKAYVFLGSAEPDTIPDFTMEGETKWSHFGWKVGSCGDLNGDGYDEVYILADGYPDNENPLGKIYIYSMKKFIVGVEEHKNTLPDKFLLKQNYPNPFNPSTNIKFSLPNPEHIEIEVYNIIGQRVEILLNQQTKAGNHEVEFNAQNLSSGIYFYRIEAGEFQDVKKMILIR